MIDLRVFEYSSTKRVLSNNILNNFSGTNTSVYGFGNGFKIPNSIGLTQNKLNIANVVLEQGKAYTISVSATTEYTGSFNIYISRSSNSFSTSDTHVAIGGTTTFNIISGRGGTYYLHLMTFTQSISAMDFNIMLNEGGSSLPFEPYKARNYGNELTQYILQGVQDTEKLNNELDITELTLQGYPIRKEYDPEYRMVIELYQDGNLMRTIDRIVQNDTVSQPILGNDNYFVHSITLIEPSAIAQKRIVDNISATYKLKDVNLETRVTFDTATNMAYTNNNTKPDPPQPFSYSYVYSVNNWKRTANFGKYISWENPVSGYGLIVASNESGTYRRDLKYLNLANFENNKLKLLLPKPKIMYGLRNTSQYQEIGYASMKVTVVEKNTSGEETGTTWTKTFLSNSDLSSGGGYPYEVASGEESYKANWLLEYCTQQSNNSMPNMFFRKYTGSESGNTTDTPIDFSSSGTLYINDITMQDEYMYDINISLYDYADALPFSQDSYIVGYTTRTKGKATSFYRYGAYTGEWSYDADARTMGYSNTVPYATSSFANNSLVSTLVQAYTTSSASKVLRHSNPYSALTLVQKAILNSYIEDKIDGVPSYNVNYIDSDSNYSYNCPFYIDENFVQTLANTQVNENFYNQKNLWEVLTEVGYYIHAVPEIKFGENDKFMITFFKLGETNKKEDYATKTTIMNFRGLDDYICATNSYITNMVQLGGQIDEIVTPKTSSEQFLVYNDTVEIQTSKPIIELLHVYAIPIKNINFDNSECPAYAPIHGLTAGTEYEITEYIYENNIYQLLSIIYNDVPNKGLALYYELGDNKIKGGQYQLPQTTTNLYSDYAIKKIMFLSNPSNTYRTDLPASSVVPAGPWYNVCINDFVFRVIYRTKDDVRQQHTRPDLRKYLLNTKWDKVPQHNQINNQTDTLVDSVAFGTNMFGKLIRTGNSEYTINEWVDKIDLLKQKGELYRIDGDLYYVSQITNMYFADHIISQVKYSKDYNQLSQIIGIPSEPRFYEISEQSSIRRDVNVDDYLLVTTDSSQLASSQAERNANKSRIINLKHISDLAFAENSTFAKWVATTFKGDNDIGGESENFGEKDLYIDVMTPVNAYSSDTTLTYEWDMNDNFGAGDNTFATGTIPRTISNFTSDNTYRSLKAIQYTDTYGKATLMDFYIMDNSYEPSKSNNCSEIINLPTSPINTKNAMTNKKVIFSNRSSAYNSSVSEYDANLHKTGLVLLKDCREAISINYNMQLITSTDQFVTSPYFFQPNKKTLKIVLLGEEVNKLSSGFIETANIINAKDTSNNLMGQYISFTANRSEIADPFRGSGSSSVVETKSYISLSTILSNVNIHHFDGTSGYEQIKAIAIVCDFSRDSLVYRKKFVLARNIPYDYFSEQGYTPQQKKTYSISNWYLGSPIQNKIFTNRQ